jgi:hypothetical protein
MINIPFIDIKRHKKPGAAIAAPGGQALSVHSLNEGKQSKLVREAQISPQKGIRMHGQVHNACLD